MNEQTWLPSISSIIEGIEQQQQLMQQEALKEKSRLIADLDILLHDEEQIRRADMNQLCRLVKHLATRVKILEERHADVPSVRQLPKIS